MLTKKLIFTLGLLFFIVSNIGGYVYKVESLPVIIPQKGIQANMDSTFYIKNTSQKTGVTYEMLDPHVTILDSGDVAVKLDLTLTANPQVEWGTVEFVSTLDFDNVVNVVLLKVVDQAVITVLDKNSTSPDFNLWNKDIKVLVEDMTTQINNYLSKNVLYTLKGAELRVQASSYAIGPYKKTPTGLDITLMVDQGMTIFILYTVMLLSVLTFAAGYFFVGGVAGWKDPDDTGWHDPRKFAKKRRPGDFDREHKPDDKS
ncbi:MAG: hypothetical protein Q9M17_07560 [Mariprofundus sp.]|nr:hypothetical protein [Mariprofundus sp.]